jgi:hypothetical protein
VHLGQEDVIQDGRTARLSAARERLLHVGHLAADQHQILAVVDRARHHDVDRGALGHGVGRLHAGGDARELHERQCWLDHRVPFRCPKLIVVTRFGRRP